MRVLVFDPNVDFALRAADFIHEHVKDAKAEIAPNLFMLRHQAHECGPWDFVVADVTAARFMEEVLEELKSFKCPVILWSTLEDSVFTTKELLNKFRLVKKPKDEKEFSSTLHNLVETA